MSKNRLCVWLGLLGLVSAISVAGCASDYHAYQDCCVPYLYCPPQPLPYTTYEDCHCPTPVGSRSYQREPDAPTSAGPGVPPPVEPMPLAPVPR